jgi:hypothetical protein
MSQPRLIVIHGPVASGKLTIAKDLAAMSGLDLFHNHMVVDLLLALFPFGHPSFVRLREKIWLEVMSEAIGASQSLVFTFAPERTVGVDFPSRLRDAVAAAGGEVAFVEVRCSDDVIEQRLEDASRAEYKKLSSLPLYRSLKQDGVFDYPPIASQCIVDSARVTPSEAAATIIEVLGIERLRGN